jgi:AraC-like DNA-binding protein
MDPMPSEPPPQNPHALEPFVSLSGTDPQGVTQSLARFYGGTAWYARPKGRPFRYRYVGVGDDQCSVRRLQVDGHVRGDVVPEGDVVVQWLTRGAATVDASGSGARSLTIGAPTLFPTDRRFFIEAEDWDQRLVHLRKGLILDVAAELQPVSDSVVFREGPQPSESAVVQWNAAVAEAVRVWRQHGSSSPSGRAAQRALVRSMLQMFPLEAAPASAGSGAPSGTRLGAAVDYIHAEVKTPLTLVDITEASGMSARGLQQAFQRTYGQSPMSYLRGVRLDRVHAELIAGSAGTTRVSDTARAWGFAHLGRFATYYRARFGEHPRTTLLRPSGSVRQLDAPALSRGASATERAI